MMRFRGGGVGHKSTREATDFFKNDRDPLDERATGAESRDMNSETDELEDNCEEEDDDLESRDMNSETDELEDCEEEDDDDLGLNEDQEEDYGYVSVREDSEDEDDTLADGDVGGDAVLVDEQVDFGPEDDGGAVDPDMEAFGYADM